MGNTFPLNEREITLPWSLTVKDQRQDFVGLARQPDANISELCSRFKISRKTGYKWLGRDDLEDRSRRPKSSPGKMPDEREALIVKLRAEHPAWGGRKLAHVLERDHGVQMAPSTANSVLRRHGLIDPAASRAATPWHLFEHETPNAMWQIDFKGHFAMDSGRCHPLTMLDDHSRFNILLRALSGERREPVKEALHSAFECFGLPERINADNGAPWGSPTPGALTALGVWLIRLGVKLTHSRPMHPQTNGKDERFHRTMVVELLQGRHFKDLQDAQKHFSAWRDQYNAYRPHEALGMQTPASRYQASRRPMPSHLPPVEYDANDLVRRVGDGGRISIKGRKLRVGKALIGQDVALRRNSVDDGSIDLYFCHHRLGPIELMEED